MNYRNPSEVPIAFELPITEADPERWRAYFRIARLDGASQRWKSPTQFISDHTFLSVLGTFIAIKTLSLDRGRCEVVDAGCKYYDEYGNHWDSGWYDFSVIFWVDRPTFDNPPQ